MFVRDYRKFASEWCVVISGKLLKYREEHRSDGDFSSMYTILTRVVFRTMRQPLMLMLPTADCAQKKRTLLNKQTIK